MSSCQFCLCKENAIRFADDLLSERDDSFFFPRRLSSPSFSFLFCKIASASGRMSVVDEDHGPRETDPLIPRPTIASPRGSSPSSQIQIKVVASDGFVVHGEIRKGRSTYWQTVRSISLYPSFHWGLIDVLVVQHDEYAPRSRSVRHHFC